MKRKNSRFLTMTGIIICLIFAGITLAGCFAERSGDGQTDESLAAAGRSMDAPGNPERTGDAQVTFVELGSDRCVPCIKMREVMDEIQRQYGERGQEYYRHEGYFPVEGVAEILARKGLKRR